MSRYRRRTKLVDALQYDGTVDGAHRLAGLSDAVVGERGDIRLVTPRGTLDVRQGDWIVKDPDTLDVTVLTNDQFFRTHDCVPVGRSAA